MSKSINRLAPINAKKTGSRRGKRVRLPLSAFDMFKNEKNGINEIDEIVRGGLK